jgi:hypothetical protein
MSISKKQLSESRKQSDQLFEGDYAVADSDLQQLVGKTILDQFTVFASRFQLAADLMANPKGKSELPKSSLEQIKQLACESNRSDYRRIMKAIESKAREGGRSIYKARMTAIQVVHLYFRYEAEYMGCLGKYEAKLRASRTEKKT